MKKTKTHPLMTLTTRITSILSDRQGITAQVEAIQALVVEVAGEAWDDGHESGEWSRFPGIDRSAFLQNLTDKSE